MTTVFTKNPIKDSVSAPVRFAKAAQKIKKRRLPSSRNPQDSRRPRGNLQRDAIEPGTHSPRHVDIFESPELACHCSTHRTRAGRSRERTTTVTVGTATAASSIVDRAFDCP